MIPSSSLPDATGVGATVGAMLIGGRWVGRDESIEVRNPFDGRLAAVVLKPASRTPLSAAWLARDLVEAGLPPERLNVVFGGGAELPRRPARAAA